MPPGRTYVSGWSSRTDKSSYAYRPTIQDTGYGSARSGTYQAPSADNTFAAIKSRCLQSGTLWEDPDFPPVKESLFFNKPPSAWPNIVWKRPKEICSDPQLFVGNASRTDVNQGILGDCWLLAAVASLTTNETMLNKVVPPDQSFSSDYAGVFRFLFWQYGRWVEVLVDDRLPTTNGKLIYMHSESRNEFWSALLEKAFAKLNGSYEALSGGLTSEALTDFTGGIVERFELGAKAPKTLLQIMMKAKDRGSLMGCSIDASEGHLEDQLNNGLIIGHAYSITDVRCVQVQTPRVSGKVPLLRIRNPWGDSHEWKGAWSDKSQEWQAVPANEKADLGLTFEHDGEFWMSYTDFLSNFQRLEICYLGPDSLKAAEGQTEHKWEGTLFEGGWKRRVNAGGCRNYPSTFWTNPQYQVSVVDPDSDDDDGNGSIIVGLMQKDRRKLRREGKNELVIGYAVYKAPSACCGTLDAKFFQTHSASARSSAFINLREVCDHHKLPPGHYVVVPSTFEPNDEGDFILRIFSEQKSNQAKELDDTTGATAPQKDVINTGKRESDKDASDAAKQAFINLAGTDGEIDAFELQGVLNSVFMKDFKFDGFSTDMTRSMVAMRDADMTGKLGFEDFKKLWADLKLCSRTFRMMDTDNSGHFNSYEFRIALNTLGLRVSNATFNAIVMRYSDKDGNVAFDDFVAAYIRLRTLFDTFAKKDASGSGTAKFDLEEFTMLTMYS
jgi:calpain